MELLPPVNQRIKNIIDKNFNGSVRAFSLKLGLDNSQKINRLFIIDIRNNKIPTPSIEILSLISNKLGISLEWLQNGTSSDNQKEILNDPVQLFEENTSDLKKLIENNSILARSIERVTSLNEDITRELLKMLKESKNVDVPGDVDCADVG